MTRCLHCNAMTDNGLALCELCRRKVSTDLEFLPIYFGNLARWRPGRAGARPVPGSRVLYDGTVPGLGTGDRISDTLDETLTELTEWARKLVADRTRLGRMLDRLAAARADERITESQAVAWLCAGFDRHLTRIATSDHCGDFVHDLGRHEVRLRGLTENYVPGWYAGGCRQLVGFDSEGAAVRCGSGTYVVPGLTWVTCGACGTTTYARDHLENVLDEARDWVDRPMRLAEAIVALVDTEQSIPRLYERIKKWEQREKILGLRRLDDDGDEIGPKRYRLGDVLDRIFTEGETRVGTRAQKVAVVS